jgi:hypothetical protein
MSGGNMLDPRGHRPVGRPAGRLWPSDRGFRGGEPRALHADREIRGNSWLKPRLSDGFGARSAVMPAPFKSPRPRRLPGSCRCARRSLEVNSSTLIFVRRDLATPRRDRPGCAFISRPLEGVGNAGCPMHPQPRVQKLVARECVATGPPESPGIPARNGFNGFLRALR